MKKILALIALLLVACASNPKIDEGRKLIGQGQLEEGLAVMEQAARGNPRNVEAYNAWVTQREAIVGGFVREGDMERARGANDPALWNYRRALAIDPSAIAAQNGIDSIERDRRHQTLLAEAEAALSRNDLDTAERNTRLVLKENPYHRTARATMKTVAERRAQLEVAPPQLKLAMEKPITLEFRDAPLRSIFEVISRTSGINFVFDRDVRPDLRATIFMRNSNLDEVIRVLLATNQLDRKVMNENSVLIYPNTPAKQKEYQELSVRSFYLTNADVKQTAAMIRALVKTRDIYIDEKLNLLVMKDTPHAIRMAEQLVATQDLGEPEVVLELEVMEVASALIRDFGIRYPDAINVGEIPVGAGAVTNFIELKPKDWDFYIANPALILNLRQTNGAVNTLANPRIRVKNREKAKIHIGEKVPVITSTSTANVGVSSSVSYLEVGLKLDVEPNIFLDDEVAIKVQLEVSNILEQLRLQDTVSYRLGTRNASTTLRLRDGETQILAGLINDEDRRSANKLPYLGDFPLLGKLFRSDSDQVNKTEIVLLVTPRIVRNLIRPDTVQAQFTSGTDASPGAAPLRLTSAAPRSFTASASGGVAPVTPAVAKTVETVNDVSLAMSGPTEVVAGEEFVLSFGLPMRVEGANARLQLSFDPQVLSLVSPAGGAPGRGIVEVAAASIAGTQSPIVQARFRAVATKPVTTQIGIEALRATDNAQRPLSLNMPGAVSINVLASPGTNGGVASEPLKQ
ncbi:MAG TPA: secretin N-terminal domain-containing protein [Burkholderiales bacterium]|nr:secretin N-terminal domain-containing protein [Burkholderiales bacterium]